MKIRLEAGLAIKDVRSPLPTRPGFLSVPTQSGHLLWTAACMLQSAMHNVPLEVRQLKSLNFKWNNTYDGLALITYTYSNESSESSTIRL